MWSYNFQQQWIIVVAYVKEEDMQHVINHERIHMHAQLSSSFCHSFNNLFHHFRMPEKKNDVNSHCWYYRGCGLGRPAPARVG